MVEGDLELSARQFFDDVNETFNVREKPEDFEYVRTPLEGGLFESARNKDRRRGYIIFNDFSGYDPQMIEEFLGLPFLMGDHDLIFCNPQGNGGRRYGLLWEEKK